MFNEVVIAKIKELLVARHQTIAVGESVTSGLFQLALSTAKEAMKFYQGGLTAYNLGQKARHLHIDPVHATACDCVSEKMAEDMAKSICLKFSSDWGVGITGYASLVPQSNDKLFAYYAICLKEKTMWSDKIDCSCVKPLDAQLYYVNKILDSASGNHQYN